MKRTVIAAATVGSLGVAAIALGARRRDVTSGRVSVSRTATVRGNPRELYEMWRSAETLARFLHRASSVEDLGERRQRWTFDVGGRRHAHDVQIVDERPAERIEWRVVRKGPFQTQGAVTFRPAPAGRGTEVRFSLGVSGPAAGALSSFARPFGTSVPQMAMESVRNFKALAEAGEIPKAVRN